MPDRLTGIEVFVAAMKLGGLSAGARALNMSPAMATKHFDALEHRLGVKLAHRSTRRLTLTEAGRQFLERSEALLRALTEAESEAVSVADVVGGKIRIAVPIAFGIAHIAPLIPAFTERYPRLIVELGLSDHHADLIAEDWDTAIRIGLLADSDLVARKLAPVRTVLAAAPAYIARRGVPKSVDDLTTHNCLGYTLSRPLGAESWSFGPQGDLVIPIRGDFRSNNGEALIAAAMAGQGIVYGPRFLACQALRDGRLIELLLDVPTVETGGVYAVSHPSRRVAAKTNAWIEFLSERLAVRIDDF
jgi:DNA-binding transcriptional LysR family regulator